MIEVKDIIACDYPEKCLGDGLLARGKVNKSITCGRAGK